MTKFVAYLRVSTQQQGRSGLGLEAQRQSIQDYVRRRGEVVPPEFVEVESGKLNERPQLQAALRRCKLTRATLIVAKLDRLSRNAAFLMALRDAKVPFVACDCPDANTLTIGVMASMAQYERETISARTKAALAAAKASGTKLGGHRDASPNIGAYQSQGSQAAAARAAAHLALVAEDLRRLQAEGLTLTAIASRLNEDDMPTSRGNAWTAVSVKRALGRLSS